jgi:hypothetical protein
LLKLKISFVLFFVFISILLIGQNETTKSEFLSFYRFNPEKLTWEEHKKRAAEMGGHLACITNVNENEQVRRIAGGEIAWVGGIRKGCGNGPGPDYWKWSNVKEWTYTNWRAGEPNNYTEHDENRVMLWENGEWNDASLFHELPAVYEIPSTSLVTYDTQSTASSPMNLTVSGAGSSEVNGNYVYVKNTHENRIFETESGHYQHTSNPAIFIGFQNCGKLFNKPEWNKWVIFTEKGARYAAHSNRQINVPPRKGKWETVDHWPAGVQEAGIHPAPNLGYYDEEHKTNPANHSTRPMSLNVSGAGSPEVNGAYVFVKNKHKNRIFATEAGHYQHTNNPSIFIAFQNCGGLLKKPEWNKWVIFTEKGARYAAHTNRQINVPPKVGKWETVHHWPAGVQEAGSYPAPNLSYYEEEPKTTTANHSPSLSIETIEILEAVTGKNVRFKLNNLPSSKDAWVGIYRPGASDQDHGEQNKRWKWLREIDVNNVSFPNKSEGDWSIRVFSDGGYTLHERKDFAVKPKREIFSSDHNTSQYSQKEILDPTQTIQNKINNEPLIYYKFIPEKMTWAEHNNRAIEMGGNLASISNAIENNKVKEISKGANVWLGGVRKGCGNDTGAEHWSWSNGEKWSYTNWMKNQPDNYQKSENRVHMTPISHGQQWNDISENERFSAVYELPINESVDYFEKKENENLNSTKIKKNPIKKILVSIFSVGSVITIQKINSNQRNN